ncbi:hypothetical protein P4639_14470 [Priestia megaterium]|uniref:hypothetical protein n=1 Tax=Priestia megaterium TaxID=1404 RepID=UPI002E1D5A15|nr:hypothetical protein [Priestia megaterium]
MSEIKITQDGGKTFPMINSTKAIVGDKDTWSIMDGQYRLKNADDEPLHGLPKGTKVLTNDETAQCIQSWYENRRD